MSERTVQNRVSNKLERIERECIYGLEYFCDGKPNKSVLETDVLKPPCPNFAKCKIRRVQIFKPLKGEYDD
jgi:hypothetical protein